MKAGVGRVQVKEVVEVTAGKGWIGSTARRAEGGRDVLDASEREESEGLPHAVPARAAYHPP